MCEPSRCSCSAHSRVSAEAGPGVVVTEGDACLVAGHIDLIYGPRIKYSAAPGKQLGFFPSAPFGAGGVAVFRDETTRLVAAAYTVGGARPTTTLNLRQPSAGTAAEVELCARPAFPGEATVGQGGTLFLPYVDVILGCAPSAGAAGAYTVGGTAQVPPLMAPSGLYQLHVTGMCAGGAAYDRYAIVRSTGRSRVVVRFFGADRLIRQWYGTPFILNGIGVGVSGALPTGAAYQGVSCAVMPITGDPSALAGANALAFPPFPVSLVGPLVGCDAPEADVLRFGSARGTTGAPPPGGGGPVSQQSPVLTSTGVATDGA